MACMCSVMSDSATPWPVPGQAPLSMQFSRQEYWSGLPIPSPGDLSNPGIEPPSCVSCIGRQVLYHLNDLGSLLYTPANYHKEDGTDSNAGSSQVAGQVKGAQRPWGRGGRRRLGRRKACNEVVTMPARHWDRNVVV